MNLEIEMLISILKLTREGPVSHELINMDARVPKSVGIELLRKLQTDDLVNFRDSYVEAKASQRLEMAFLAMKGGADAERVSSFLQWKEFEGFAEVAFEQNGYSVTRNLHFKCGGRRWEMDIVACKKPLIVCVDCKHWHHGFHKSVLAKIAEEQVERTVALVGSLPNSVIKHVDLSGTSSKIVPTILSLVVDRVRFCRGIPIVPVMKLQDFLNKLPVHVQSLNYLSIDCLKNPSLKQMNTDDRY